ncbi:MAG: bacteriohemerythrin [Deltaproteobacteria bacterium]|nr:bacteriohemerythrin [Deltaproteobacteria bacterium]
MAIIQWNDSLKTNIGEIDSQHQRLIKLINDLDDAMRVGKGKDLSGKIVSELAAYTLSHFSTEEKYFHQYGYPEAPAHKEEHQRFVAEVSRFKTDFDAGRMGLTIKLMDFLSDWLKNHIQKIDKQYVPFFKGKGLA